jgi:hypothetical protein
LAFAGLIAGSVAAAPPALHLETLSGKPVAATPGVTILAFWRADCAPCLIELREAAAYAEAAKPGRILFVGLQAAPKLEAARLKAGAPGSLVARAPGDSSAILISLNGAPPRLPLAVAMSAGGEVCARRAGLLGTDTVRTWARRC